jgi:hypothetical protein
LRYACIKIFKSPFNCRYKFTYPPSRNGTPDIMLIPQVLICQIVFRANKDSTGSIISTRNGHEEIRMFLQWFTVFTNNMVQAKIQLVERQCLLCLVRCLSCWICVCFLQKGDILEQNNMQLQDGHT